MTTDIKHPVAWMVYTEDGQSAYVTDNPSDIKEGQRALALYAEPREWQGLTDEEFDTVIRQNVTITDPCLMDGVVGVVLDVEALLKEKNA